MSDFTPNQDNGKQTFDVIVSGTDRAGDRHAYFEGTVTSSHKRGAKAVGRQIKKALKRQGLSHNMTLEVDVQSREATQSPRSR